MIQSPVTLASVQEAEKKVEEERIRMENIIKGNPLMQAMPDKQADFKVKRRSVVVLSINFHAGSFVVLTQTSSLLYVLVFAIVNRSVICNVRVPYSGR